ncbi:hypothetical protein GINT2_000239 [Glugoides intestinalis]
MSFKQTILGFTRSTIKYCLSCNVKYNAANAKDVKFHEKLHRQRNIPRAMEITKYFYQKKNNFYYGQDQIKASCKVKNSKTGAMAYEFWFDCDESKELLISNLRLIYSEVSISK